MFKTLPDGVEIYFSWPSRTAHIVRTKSVKHGIMARDGALFSIVTFMGLMTAVLGKPSPVLGWAVFLLAIAGFIERGRYLSKLEKLSLELVPGKAKTQRIASSDVVQITSTEIDKAYIREWNMFDGVLLTATGVLMTAGMSWLLSTEVPLVFSVSLLAAGLAVTYVGVRIIAGRLKQRGARHKKREDAI